MRLAVTRPQPDAERTAQALRQRGHKVLIAPVVRIEPVAANLAGQYAAVLITSGNAVRALAGVGSRKSITSLPLFAVGARSAEAAREAGFTEVSSAEGNAADLARLVAARCKGAAAPLLYLVGEDRAADLSAPLKESGIAVKTAVIYRAAGLPLAPPLAAALKAGAIDGVLHFSARSAAFYLAGARTAGLLAQALRPRHFCLSSQVAAPMGAAAAPYVAIAARPDERALLECVDY